MESWWCAGDGEGGRLFGVGWSGKYEVSVVEKMLATSELGVEEPLAGSSKNLGRSTSIWSGFSGAPKECMAKVKS